ncbi:nagb/rpia/CoA transferase-like protein [Linderina pennispora]|uniref:6-phosphogluconolactonase n=1 Tax=Linderina pennispora TaxID=61395 RepID=A0A1Y1W5M2_9FUNG|nr:nagb/rpia/CoA transferase-like protein [Linderina pennispora]ORX68840.1 nagb/rpia/CoA transferase-like protein [Linderina pennispora]
MAKVFSFPSPDDVSHALETYLAQASATAIASTGRFTIAITGGSLPATAFKFLKASKSVDFSKWHVFWGDERCVPYDHDDSNYKLVKEQLLDHVNVPKSQVFPINQALVGNSAEAAKDYHGQLAFDCILLGIGPDGHLCSLFPGFPQVNEKEKWVTHIDDSPKPPPHRITLTMPVLNNAKEAVFVVTGSGKSEMFKTIVEDRDMGKPSTHVAPASGKLYWFVDDAASQHLSAVKPSTFKL